MANGEIRELCDRSAGVHYFDGDECNVWPYQITHMQVGTGASSVTESSSVVVLGNPLGRHQYGGVWKNTILEDEDHMIYSEENIELERQTVARIGHQSVVGSSLVSVIVLDEETANGQDLNEIGLFVNNPYMKTRIKEGIGFGSKGDTKTLGGSSGGSDTGFPSVPPVPPDMVVLDPGNLLAAYRQFSPIKKDSSFMLIIRWAINFTEECA
jgi:hypothetical protein